MEERLAGAAGLFLEPAGERGPGRIGPVERRCRFGGLAKKIAILRRRRPLDMAVEDVPPIRRLGDFPQIGANRGPVGFGHAGRQPIGHRREIELVDDCAR